jgi:hypothetical protein
MKTESLFRYKHYLRVINKLKENNILPMFDFSMYKGVKNNYEIKCSRCNFDFISSLDCGIIPKCPKCFPNRLTVNIGHPNSVNKNCEYCNKLFNIIWKNRNHRFCSVFCKCEFIKENKREIISCLKCGKPFERYKNILRPSTGKPTQYCSNFCSVTSLEKKQKLKKWALSDKNHWNNPECQKKVKETKLKRYGDENYNNLEKNKQTMMDRYGVPFSFYLPKCKTNGKRVSNFQKRIYVEILKESKDALLEEYLRDVQKSVDIFIPSKKKVVECFGDYWHCNPTKFQPNYYNELVHLTAQQIWDKDKNRIELLRQNGYIVEIVWENTNKNFKHLVKE